MFYEVDYYRVDDEPGFSPIAYEKAFGEFESKAAVVLARVSDAGALPARNSPEYSTLINFIALQAVRGPHARRRLAEVNRVMSRALEHAEQLRQAFGPRMRSPEAVDALRRKVERGDTRAGHLKALLTAVNGILQPLAYRTWALVRPAPGRAFVLSDHPIALTWSSNHHDGDFFGPGFGLSETDVTVPLDSDTLLWGRFEGDSLPPSGSVLSEAGTALVNSRCLMHAVRFAAARSDDFVWLANNQILGLDQLCDYWKSQQVSSEEDLRVPADAEERDR